MQYNEPLTEMFVKKGQRCVDTCAHGDVGSERVAHVKQAADELRHDELEV